MLLKWTYLPGVACGSGWESGSAGDRKVVSSIPWLLLAERRGVPEQDTPPRLNPPGEQCSGAGSLDRLWFFSGALSYRFSRHRFTDFTNTGCFIYIPDFYNYKCALFIAFLSCWMIEGLMNQPVWLSTLCLSLYGSLVPKLVQCQLSGSVLYPGETLCKKRLIN